MKLFPLLLVLAACWPTQDAYDTCLDSCGVRAENFYYSGSRVVGGWSAEPGTWPWIVSIQVPWARGTGHICGGSLITSQWVLSAAHCFINGSYFEMWRVVAGTSDLLQLGPEAQVRHIRWIVIHEHYSTATEMNDLALVLLDYPVQCGHYVQLACVPDNSLQVPGMSPCFVAGWGNMYEGAPEAPHILQEALVELIDNRICNRSDWNDGLIMDTHLCAGYQEGGVGTCQGDSGGPLVCKDRTGDFYWLVGVTSWGKGCARMQLPPVYSSVQRYYKWIVNNINMLQETSQKRSRSSSGFSQLPRPRPTQSPRESSRRSRSSYPGYSQYHKPVPTQSAQRDPCPYPTHKLVEFFTGVQQLLNILKANKP